MLAHRKRLRTRGINSASVLLRMWGITAHSPAQGTPYGLANALAHGRAVGISDKRHRDLRGTGQMDEKPVMLTSGSHLG